MERGDIERFTASRHCWDAVEDKIAVHDDIEIGKLKETHGHDISLVETAQSFSNKLLDIDTKAQRFIHAESLKFRDIFVMDSPFTGSRS